MPNDRSFGRQCQVSGGPGESAEAWAARNGCSLPTLEVRVSEHVRLFHYDGCSAAAVELYVVEGGGHTWSGATDVARLGATTHEISATALAAHAMP